MNHIVAFHKADARDMRTGTIHLSVRSGSRGGGASASAAFAYVTRTGDFAERDLDEMVHTESDHMPAWATDDPQEYWKAADLYERANGRLFVSADFALPRDLDRDTHVALARTFVHALTDDEQLPYTLAIHAGRDRDGREHNPPRACLDLRAEQRRDRSRAVAVVSACQSVAA